MSVSYSPYSPRLPQTRTEPTAKVPSNHMTSDLYASNVRPASANLLANRMDALSLQVGRLACYGLE